MAVNYKNTIQDLYSSSIDTAPRSIALAGTASSTGTLVTGVGTSFLTLTPGYWIFNNTNEIRLITGITSNTSLTIAQAFTTPLSSSTINYVPPSKALMISWATLTSGALIDNISTSAGQFGGWAGGLLLNGSPVYIDPIIINTTSGTVAVETLFNGITIGPTSPGTIALPRSLTDQI